MKKVNMDEIIGLSEETSESSKSNRTCDIVYVQPHHKGFKSGAYPVIGYWRGNGSAHKNEKKPVLIGGEEGMLVFLDMVKTPSEEVDAEHIELVDVEEYIEGAMDTSHPMNNIMTVDLIRAAENLDAYYCQEVDEFFESEGFVETERGWVSECYDEYGYEDW